MNIRYLLPIFFCLSSLLFANDQELMRKVHAHILLEDYGGAYNEARDAWEADPGNIDKIYPYLEALAAIGKEREAIDLLYSNYELLKDDRRIFEDVSWAVIKKGQASPQYTVRLISLIGAHLTNDAKAVHQIIKSMNDQNAVIRAVSINLASRFHDLPLQKQVKERFLKERIWFVRLELIKAAGDMQIKSLTPELLEIAASSSSTYEERAYSIESLVKIYDRIDLEEIIKLSKSPSGGMRAFACDMIAHLHMEEAEAVVRALLKDPLADVRVKALNTLSLVFLPTSQKDDSVSKDLLNALNDPNPDVAITACWACMRFLPDSVDHYWEKWILQKNEEYARFAAAALAATGHSGEALAKRFLKQTLDPYVRMNLALGLIGQRTEVQQCCDILSEGLSVAKKWMWDNQHNELIPILSPSRIRHVDHIPHYPEAIDQTTRLEILSILAVVEDPRAEEQIKKFLQTKKWGITGFAAATLLREGDESSLAAVQKMLEDKDTKVRVQAALVMAFLGKDPSVIPILEETYFTADHEMKGYILEAMGSMGTKKHLPFFLKVLKEPSQVLRVIAATSIIQSLNR